MVYRRGAASGAVTAAKTAPAGGFAACLCRARRRPHRSGAEPPGPRTIRGWVCRVMNPPLHKLQRSARSEAAGRTVTVWLALLALLGNIMLPAAVSIAFSLTEPGSYLFRTGLCGGSPGDVPGKAKPVLLVQHCPLCTVPGAALPRPPAVTVPAEAAEQHQFQLRAAPTIASVRHGRMQARAPPAVV